MSSKSNDPNAKTMVYGSRAKESPMRPSGPGIVLPPGASFPDHTRDSAAAPKHGDRLPSDQITRPVPNQISPKANDGKTTIARGVKPTVAPSNDPMSDPVAGWLAVIEGPGRGHIRTIGYGFNRIGRDKPARILLDFGDNNISRESHAAIVYDQINRQFFLAHTAGTNLTYCNGELVIGQVLLKAGDVISLGSVTALRFVPLCGESFDWETTNYGQE